MQYEARPLSKKIWTLLCWILVLGASMPIITGCESNKTIVHDLDEKEANEILNLLASKSIDAIKEKALEGGGGSKSTFIWNIVVPSDKAPEAMAILNQSGLPRRRPQTLLNIFANSGLVPSEMTEKIRYQSGLSESLASIIRKMDGVIDAEVQISFPEEDPLHPGENKQKMTASVYVKYSPLLDDPNVHLSTKVKQLVASGVPGLDYDNVTVVLDRARFANIDLTQTPAHEEKSFVNIWSVIVAQESVTKFRIIFFAFIILLLLLLTLLGWLLWKLNPLIERAGGYKALFSLTPLTSSHVPEESTEEKPEKDEKREAADAEIDETEQR